MLTIFAPAKVNIVLEVLRKTADMHQITSIMQTINLCDVIQFQLSEDTFFRCNEPGLQDDNIVEKSASLLRELTNCAKGVKIELHKYIPCGAGFGGGSSDAANTLLALNQLWSLNLQTNDLIQLASKLGSDVPFFIHGGTALVEGTGEKVTPIVPLLPTWFVLLMPALHKIQHKTRQLYSRFNRECFTEGKFVSAALLSIKQKRTIAPPLMFNAFENIAFDFFPKLTEYKQIFHSMGASRVYLAGSGPGLFTIMTNEEQAKKLSSNLKNEGLESYAVSSFTARTNNHP